jgi:ubiquinone/menaquinone biosynthesis methyltransferase
MVSLRMSFRRYLPVVLAVVLLMATSLAMADSESESCSPAAGLLLDDQDPKQQCADDTTSSSTWNTNTNNMFRPTLDEELTSADSKRAVNLEIFTRIASEYDLMTLALSFGWDGSWKRQLVAKVSEFVGAVDDDDDDEKRKINKRSSDLVFVDLACGTGEISTMIAEMFPGSQVTGIDLTPGMIDVAKKNQQQNRPGNKNNNIKFEVGDMTNLTVNGIQDDSVDVVTGGYAIRNAPELRVALKEIHRILKPGGVAAFLDFSRSSVPLLSDLGYWALKLWGGFWGLVRHGQPWVYGYIADSLQRYPNRHDLGTILEESGLTVTHRQLHMCGLLETVHLRKKKQEEEEAVN